MTLCTFTSADEALSTGIKPAGDRDWTLPLTISPALFEKFQRLIYTETGIWLGSSKTALLCGRLMRRLRALGIPNLAEYYRLISEPEQHSERVLMIDAITTNETRFFREPRHFDVLSNQVFPFWKSEASSNRRPKKIRVWSAGCSSGEEPYSLAMLLAEHFSAEDGWDVQVLATDISTKVLTKASSGIYSITKSDDIPKHLLHEYMLKGIAGQEGHMKVTRQIQQMVQFTRLNLNQAPYPMGTLFHLIFCRNVLIYFHADSRRRVVENLARCLSPDGLLFAGHAENLKGITARLRSLGPGVYCRAETDNRFTRSLQGRYSCHS